MTITPSKGFRALLRRVEAIIQQQACTPALVSIKQICSIQTRIHDCIALLGFLFLKVSHLQHSLGHRLWQVGLVCCADTEKRDTDAAQFLPSIFSFLNIRQLDICPTPFSIRKLCPATGFPPIHPVSSWGFCMSQHHETPLYQESYQVSGIRSTAMVTNQEGCPSETKPLHPSRGAVPAFHSKGKCREAV